MSNLRTRYSLKDDNLKTHRFIDDKEPKFINSMARTMDAFNLQMSTFGGNSFDDRSKNYNEFISEKRGFLRAINGYSSIDLKQGSPLRCENGPNAFLTSFDNRYKEKTACATDRARPLNINQSSPNSSFEKVEPIKRNKQTNIKSYDNYNHLEKIEEYEPKPYYKKDN